MPQSETTAPTTASNSPYHRAHAHRRRAATPRLVWAATGLYIALAVVFAFFYPAYWGLDESGHVSRVLEAQHGELLPTPTKDPYVAGVGNTYQFFTVPDQPPFIAYQPPSRAVRPSFGMLDGAKPYVVPGALPNQLAQHPPGYYLLAAAFLDAIPGSAHLAWDQTINLLRLLDVVLLAPMPFLCWAVARRYASPRVAIAAAFAPAMAPALQRLGGSVTNDDLVILLFSVFTLLATRVLDGDRSARTAVGMACCIAGALLVKGFALVLPAVALTAYVVAWPGTGRRFPWRPAVIVAVGSAAGGLWWVRNQVVYGAVQPAGLTPTQADQVWRPLPPGVHEHVVTYLRQSLDSLTTGFWGGLGHDHPPSLPGVLTFGASAVLILLTVAGLAAAARVGGARRMCSLVVLLLPMLLVAVPFLVHGWFAFAHTGQLAGVQGRYLYPGLVGWVACAAAGADALLARRPRVLQLLPFLACIAAVVMDVAAVWVLVAKDWLPDGVSPLGGFNRVLRAVGALSPWPSGVTITLLAAAAVTVAASLAAAVGSALRPLPGQRATLSTYQE